MLWEDGFYESGESIAARIASLVAKVDPVTVAKMAVECRESMKIRHAPLLVAREMARLPSHRSLVAELLSVIIQRPAELCEFLAIYWKDKRQPLSAQVKKGLARAFAKFSPYQLAKYNRDAAVKLKDVLFLCHAKPSSEEQAATWKELIAGTLAAPDTWEVALSAGQDKKATWERLIAENKLGALALMRNLRNMEEVGVNRLAMKNAILACSPAKLLPFQIIAAAKHAPQWEYDLEALMLRSIEYVERLPGRTILMIDVSGSMDSPISSKSQMTRLDAACGLAIILRDICQDIGIVTFSNNVALVPPRRGFALRDAIRISQPHSGTYLGAALNLAKEKFTKVDRWIIITDEQSHDSVGTPGNAKGYMLNVATNQNSVGFGPWVRIAGWSENVVEYIGELEKSKCD
jgi:hypothetical protein